jgi:oxalate decarboxylase/phosphoglucose isomerase-like protein (cupin superfamily)
MRRISIFSKVGIEAAWLLLIHWLTRHPGSIPKSIDEEKPPAFKKSKHQYTHHMLDTPADEGSGGKARIVDSKNFPISKTIAAGHLDIEPGAMREMHWHPNADEWYNSPETLLSFAY